MLVSRVVLQCEKYIAMSPVDDSESEGCSAVRGVFELENGVLTGSYLCFFRS